jgi:hypothetical protein
MLKIVMSSIGITNELVTRICAITAVFSVISFVIVWKNVGIPGRLEMAIPPFFVLFGVVILISVLYCLKKYHVPNK